VRFALTAAVLTAAGLGVFEVTMSPTAAERVGAGIVFGLMAAAMALAAAVLPHLVPRLRSLRMTVVALSAVSLLVVALGVVIAGRQMFISVHDLTLLGVLVGFGVVAAMLFSVAVSGPLTDDLGRISATATAIAGGDLTARTGVSRVDEVGEVAEAVDTMADILQVAASARAREEEARHAFFAAVGHDLRTPLASLRAAVEALQDGVADDPVRYLGSMEQDVEVLSRMVEDLFLLARLESGDVAFETDIVDVTEVADESIEVFRPIAAARGVSLQLEAAARVTVSSGGEALARVLRNLLDNAIRHSPDGGEVVVKVSNGLGVEVLVADQGPGFSPQFAERAFDRFSRGDPSRHRASGGAGLGLAIARGYVTALGGDIRALPGPGGRVVVRLPGD
jgi:signal transduction histidine kinase